jgi:hypothetical protein
MNANDYLTRRVLEIRAELPPVITVVTPRLTDPGLRYRMAAYDATHTATRGVLVDEKL